MAQCSCGSEQDFSNCCEPILNGSRPAETAMVLMRARYSAFVTNQTDFLHESLHPDHRHDHDLAATKRWAEKSQWLGLEILNVRGGESDDTEGEVEFIATYKADDLVRSHHEISKFSKVDGVWYFVDGELVLPKTEIRDQPKVGRNDPCPCGSGKKYKKCCGK